jgi:hypothetical protein
MLLHVELLAHYAPGDQDGQDEDEDEDGGYRGGGVTGLFPAFTWTTRSRSRLGYQEAEVDNSACVRSYVCVRKKTNQRVRANNRWP